MAGVVLGMASTAGEAAQHRGPGTGLDRLGLLLARLAQVRVHVDQTGATAAAGVEGHVGRRRRRRPPRDAAVLHSTSAGREPVASTTSPPRMTIDFMRPSSLQVPARAEQVEQHGHAHRHPVAHLVDHDRGRSATSAPISTPGSWAPGA